MLTALALRAARRSGARPFAAAPAAAAPRPPRRDVPEGHARSDLRPTSCHIGLNRRRDLTLRADVKLYGQQASGAALADVFKVREKGGRIERFFSTTSYPCRRRLRAPPAPIWPPPAVALRWE
jgi:hypothetical protein